MAAAMTAATVVACAQSAADEARTGAAGAPPRRGMVAVLPALGPHPSLGHHADLFGRFVGAWDADYSFIAEDGSVRHSRGEVLFGWILDGYALQDIFLGYPKPGSNEERRMVTGVRFVDPKTDKWTVMFAAPSFAAAIRMEGGAEGDRIVLRGHDDHGAEQRWSFNDITPNSFIWRGETSHDGGKTWNDQRCSAPWSSWPTTGRSYAGHSTTSLPIPSSGAARHPTMAGRRGGWMKSTT